MEYILVFGVAKLYRMEGCVRKSHKRMGWQATGRRVSTDEDIVNLASNFVSIGEQDTVNRWSASERQHLYVLRPGNAKLYSECMGGVGKLNLPITLYRINAKTKKWPVRIISHFFDLVLANAWIEYRDIHRIYETPKKDLISRKCIRVLDKGCIAKKVSVSCHPQNDAETLKLHKKKKKTNLPSVWPVHDVRYDKHEHFPEHVHDLGRMCKLEGCSGRSVKCTK